MNDTTTTFNGDIRFKRNEKDVLVSSLPTMDEVNAAIENKIIPSGDSNFTLEDGFPYYTFKNSDVKLEEHSFSGRDCWVLCFELPDDIKNRLLEAEAKTKLYRIHLKNTYI